METSLGRRCIICNTIISDDNPDGIGYSCRSAYNRAKYIIFNEDNPYELWNVIVANTMRVFIDMFSNVKFRNNFRKNFVPSVITQYKEKGRLSKKQLEICENFILEKNYERYEDMILCIAEEKRERINHYMNNYRENASSEDIERIKSLINKNYKKG